MEQVTNQLETMIYGIISTEPKQLKKNFCIRLIGFETWGETISNQTLWKSIGQGVIHFRYTKMHLESHISESIRRMGSSDHFTTDHSARLNIANVKEGYCSTNKVNYIREMLEHNDRFTSLDYMVGTLSYLVLPAW
jgi:hypothetical protein